MMQETQNHHRNQKRPGSAGDEAGGYYRSSEQAGESMGCKAEEKNACCGKGDARPTLLKMVTVEVDAEGALDNSKNLGLLLR
jgi:hypothetical protein